MKHQHPQRDHVAAPVAQAVPAVRQEPTRVEGKVLHCYIECLNAAVEGDKQPAFDLCRINMDTGLVTPGDAARAPLIWYGDEIALRLAGAMPTFTVVHDKKGLALTADALTALKLALKKPIVTEEFEVTVPADGPLGTWAGKDVQRGKRYRKLVITGSRQYIEANRLRTAAESKGWQYLICATIDIDSIHLCMFKPVVEEVVPAAVQVAMAPQEELEAEPA